MAPGVDFIATGHPVAHSHVGLHPVDEHRQGQQLGGLKSPDQLADVGLGRDHMLAVEQQAHHRPAGLGVTLGAALGPVPVVPAEVGLRLPKHAAVVGMDQPPIGRFAHRRHRSHRQPPQAGAQVEHQGGQVVGTAGIPVAVEDQPVA